MSRIGTLELPSCQCPIWSEREKETDMGLPSLHQTINLSESVMLTSSRMAVFHSRSIGNTANDSELTVSTARMMLDQSCKIWISYSVYSRNRYIQHVTFHGHQIKCDFRICVCITLLMPRIVLSFLVLFHFDSSRLIQSCLLFLLLFQSHLTLCLTSFLLISFCLW